MYERRRDKLRFESMAVKLNNAKKAFDFCVANFVHNNDKWIYEDYQTSESIYNEWKRYMDGFKYRFTEEYKKLEGVQKKHGKKFGDMIVKTESGNQPPLLQLLLFNEFTPEFVCKLDSHFHFIQGWYDMYKKEDPFLANRTFILTRYTPILRML